MAWGHSKKTVILVGATDISVYTNTSDFGRTAGFDDVTGYGKDDKVKAGDLRDAKFTCGGTYDNAATLTPRVAFSTHLSETLTITRRPEGTGSGKPQQLFAAVLVDYTESSPVANYIKWSATLEVSDAVNDAAQV
jgi:hypothetical protein